MLPAKVEAERITGQLASDLTLEGLRVVWTHGDAKISEVRFRLQPLYLLAGSVTLSEMEVRDVGVRPSFAALGHTGYLTFARKVLDTF